MSEWQIAMLCIVPLMWSADKARTWMVLVAAGLAGQLYWSPGWFLTIDLLAASAVLARPRGLAQRAIGLLFAAMAIFDIGFLLSAQYGDGQYTASLAFLGWMQWGILLLWGFADGRRSVARLYRTSRGLPDIVAGRV